MKPQTIRSASMEEVPLIRELAEAAWWPAYREILAVEQIRYMLEVLYSPEALEEQMHSGHEFLILSEEGPLGFASWSRLPDTATGRLHKIYVVPAAQGKGVGKALIQAVERHACNHSCRLLELNVNRLNKARGFYEKLGFRVERAVDIPIGPYFMNDYIMQKELFPASGPVPAGGPA